MMVLKTAPILVYGGVNNNKNNTPDSKLGVSGFVFCRRPSFFNFKVQRDWECLSQRAITHMKDEIPSATTQITPAGGFYRDLNSLPKPLSAADFSAATSNGKEVHVAYQGVPGAYSEAAALKAYPNCETVPCDLYEAAFKAVELWIVDKAVLPIENSVGGSIHRNYDLLLRHRLHIVGEVQLVVNHCLLGLRGVRKNELKRVLSHPQALDQCETTLNELGLTRVSVDDTAYAAQIVASEGVRETGAVASVRAAEIYGLDVLAERIQDESDNITRFLILAREPIIPGTDKPYTTSIVFSLEEGPGILFKALAVFALRDINLSKIESRPQKMRPLRVVDDSNWANATYFDYLFYIDFEASMAEPRAQSALGHLQEFAKFI
ncbi:ADP,ATP carrier protein [Castilleja foliolosa]|uniref:Arogenate dehydratase n=1 Tax=Castilleja foliolosa TaxID=1961234 RepID=A0ABD3C788_9LAMI